MRTKITLRYNQLLRTAGVYCISRYTEVQKSQYYPWSERCYIGYSALETFVFISTRSF